MEQEPVPPPSRGLTSDEDLAKAYLASLDPITSSHHRRRAAFKAKEAAKAKETKEDVPPHVYVDPMSGPLNEHPWVIFNRVNPTQRHKLALEMCGELQWTSLHAASRAGDLDAVQRGLSARRRRSMAPSVAPTDVKVRVDLQCVLRRDASGRIALHHAVECEHWAVVKWLLKRADAPTQLRVLDFSHRSATHYALEKLERLALSHHCRRKGELPSSVTTLMRTLCAPYRRLWRDIDHMLTRMPSLDVPTMRQTPLFGSDFYNYFARGSRMGWCNWRELRGMFDTDLVESVEELDFRCRGDLWDACRTGDMKRLEFLVNAYYSGASGGQKIEASAVLSELRWSLLLEAASRADAMITHFLLANERLSCFRHSPLLLLQDAAGCNALHCAAKRLSLDICTFLVDECAGWGESDRDDLVTMGEALALAQDVCGRTALHWSLITPAPAPLEGVEQAARSVVASFLARMCPAALHVRDHDGRTALHLAVERGDPELVKFFLDLGADANAAIPPEFAREVQQRRKTKAAWTPCFLLLLARRMAREDDWGPNHPVYQLRMKAKLASQSEGMEEEDAPNAPKAPDAQEAQELQEAQDAQDTQDVQDDQPLAVPDGSSSQQKTEDSGQADMEQAAESQSGLEIDNGAPPVYYWIRRMTARRVGAKPAHSKTASDGSAPAASSSPKERRHSTDDKSDEPVGCFRFGGSCDDCRFVNRDKPSRWATSPLRVGIELPLPPLLVALRCCAHATGSRFSDRVAIVEMLLESGAHPDGSVDTGRDESSDIIQMSSLMEAFRTGKSALVSTLLIQGATAVDFDRLEDYKSTDWSGDTLESLLAPLASLPGAVESKSFAFMLFSNKCFSVLTQAIDVLSSVEQQPSEGSVWRTILRHLEEAATWRRPRGRCVLVDKDHLEFLYRATENVALDAPVVREPTMMTEDEDALGDEEITVVGNGLAELIKFCVNHCLQIWMRPSNLDRHCKSADTHRMDEEAVALCIRLLSQTGWSESVWLEKMIACGFFQTATRELAAQLESGSPQVSLDSIFRAFGKGVYRLTRVNADDTDRPSGEFLCAWLDKLFLQTNDERPVLVTTFTMRSVVYTCAYNLPIHLIERCLDLATAGLYKEGFNDIDSLLKVVEAVRVNGKHLEEWLVFHQRLDAIQVLIRAVYRAPQSAWIFWRSLMAAYIATLSTPSLSLFKEDADDGGKWISELLALSSSLEVMCASSSEFELNTMEWLLIRRAVPNDCGQVAAVLLSRIQQLQATTKEEFDGEGGVETENGPMDANGGADCLRQWCDQTRLVYECARWNATRVFSATIDAIRGDLSEEDVKKWVTDAATRVNAVDGESPVTIARLLCNLPILRAISASSLPPTPSCENQSLPEQCQRTDCKGNLAWSIYDEHVVEPVELSTIYPGFKKILLTTSEDTEDATIATTQTANYLCNVPKAFSTRRHPRHWWESMKLCADVADHFHHEGFDVDIPCWSRRVHHMAVLATFVSASALPTTISSRILGGFVLVATSRGARDSLRWLLSTYNTARLTADTSSTCVRIAADLMARGDGSVFVDILSLMLDHSFHPGRLSGDGGDTTILHRAASISDPLLARRMMTRILAIDGCDVNVRDSHGNSPVAYALGLGRLENAFFLLQHPDCRLEAEFEGQSSLYYTLHVVLSSTARRIVKAMLMAKRGHAFLHCEAEAGACACKSFEEPADTGGNTDASTLLCGFCDHDRASHCVFPLPAWFRDVYATYTSERKSREPERPWGEGEEGKEGEHEREPSHHDSENSGENDGEIFRELPRPLLPNAELEALENSCGRLSSQALERIAWTRYAPAISAFGLHDTLTALSCIPPASDPDASAEVEEGESDDKDAVSGWPVFDLHVLDVVDSEPQAGDRSEETESRKGEASDGLTQWVRLPAIDALSQLPWFLRADAALLHPPNCVCQCALFATTPAMLLHVAVARWMRLTVAKALTLDVASVHALNAWRLATTRPAVSEPVEPAASSSSDPSVAPPPPSDREQLLKRAVVAHWQLGRRAVAAFRSWKLRSASPELALHALEDAALGISSAMRRSRFEVLQSRQQHVQEAARALGSP